MHNSPLKCTTNNEASPQKTSSPKLQDQAYRSGEKPVSRESPSPVKQAAAAGYSPSPQKTKVRGENA